MKKKIIITLFTAILLAILSVTAFAYATGDVTGDGKVVAADARLALRYSAKIEELSEEQFAAADVDKSGQVTASDARKILRVAAKVDPPFEGLNIDEYLIEKGVLNVAVPKDNAPFAYEENGELKGIDVSTMKQFAEKMNLELKLHPMSYDECLDAVKNGKCDMATSVNISGKLDGFSNPRSYYLNTLSVIVAESSPIKSVAEIKDNASIKIGVLDNTIGKLIVEKNAEKSRITVFATCKEAVTALKNGSVDAFIANDHYAHTTYATNGGLEILTDEDYYSYNHSVVVAADNAGILDTVGVYITVDGVKDFDKADDSLRLSFSQKNITLAPGGTAIVEVVAESFYVENPYVYIANNSCFCKHKLFNVEDRTYLIVSANESSTTSGTLTIGCTAGSNPAEIKLNLKVSENGPTYYQCFDETKIPDFGAFTGTSPEQTDVDIENGVIVHAYNAYDLYNNGITDTSKLDAYLDSLEAAGYAYMGYQEIANTVTFIFGNEKTEEVVTYVEAYDEEGYLAAIGVGYMLPDYMF